MNPRSRTRLLLPLALLSAVLIWAGVCEFEDYLRRPLPIDAAQEIEVARGSTLGAVIRDLAARNLLKRPALLQLYVRLSGRGDHIQAGEYLVGPGTTPLDLLTMLERGRVLTRGVTLVEGWTVAQVRQLLARDEHLQKVLTAVPDDQLLAALGIDSEPGRKPEGWFFPDTYVFSGKTSDRDILLQAYHRMQEVLEQEWSARAVNLPYQTPYEALIMASIVERETGVAVERPEIAGVFVRRLQKSMLLQTDPAVIYGLGPDFDGNLRRRDLDDAGNPYNTYLRPGLPPTPIALPGRAAIRAALQPGGGSTLYFVARGDGTHQFSSSLEEHNQAVRKYQLNQRRTDYRSSPGPSSKR